MSKHLLFKDRKEEFPGRPYMCWIKVPASELCSIRHPKALPKTWSALCEWTNRHVYNAVMSATQDMKQLKRELAAKETDLDKLRQEVKRLEGRLEGYEPKPKRELTPEQEESLHDRYDIDRELTADLGSLPR